MSDLRRETFAKLDEPVGREQDFHAWLLSQAAKARHREHDLDWDSLAEELEAMAASEERGLTSNLARLLTHLLKWAYQVKKRSGSWEASIENARDEIRDQLESSPSLRPKLRALTEKAYQRARRTAGAQMGLDRKQWDKLFPEDCPWRSDRFLDDDFWPDASTSSTLRKTPAA